MGWLSMTRSGMATFATPKAYLDNQCTYTPDPEKGRDKGLRVLKSTVRSNAYYAACQSYTADGPEQTFAIICLIKWNPAARDGYLFAYKDQDEMMGPYKYDCPASILDLLGPPGNDYAAQWREQCRQRSSRRPGERDAHRTRPGCAGQAHVYNSSNATMSPNIGTRTVMQNMGQ